MELSVDQLDRVRKLFTELNRERLKRTRSLMRARQSLMLDVVPLLFHVNHPALPGFSGHDCPSGVSAYMPAEKIIKQVRNLWRNFELQRQTQWQYDIEALFIMGSCGSIAFSRKSDFDFWLCHRNDLPPEQLKKLQQKASGIENWAADQGLEVHFFLMNADSFRQGKMSTVDEESSGSAQHQLLLDEFYRTSVWLAGKHPAWWYVPPEMDAEYDAVVRHLQQQKVVSDLDYIDFGPMYDLPVEEFFGAALWQMNKGLESPYKSVLKITLMESYASQYPSARPLSALFKQRLYEAGDHVDASALDPYMMLIEYLEEYLLAHAEDNQAMRLEFLRHSFYVKLGLPLSIRVPNRTWRHDEIEALVESWGWSEDDIALLDNRKHWSVTEILQERKLIVDHLTRSYQFLSAFAREHSQKSLINASDLNILGRKLYSIFERKPGKIDLITKGVAGKIQEDVLTYFNAKSADGEDRWLLFRGKVVAADVKQNKPIKVTDSMIELLAWCYFNQVVGSSTQVLLHAPNVDLGKYDIDAIRGDFAQIAPDARLPATSPDALNKPARNMASVLYINVGHTPPVVISGKDKGLVAGSHDVMTYGADASIICRLEWFYINSWQEVHVKTFDGVSGFVHWLTHSINTQLQGRDQNCLPTVRAFSSHLSNIIIARIEKLYQRVCEIYAVKRKLNVQYVIESGERQFLLLVKDGKLKLAEYDTRKALLHALSIPSPSFREVALDKEALRGTVYSVVFSRNQAGQVQVFYLASRSSVAIYIVDENGALYERVYKSTEPRKLLAHYVSFIRRVLGLSEHELIDRVSCYRLEREKYQFDDSQMDLELLPMPSSALSIQAKAREVNGKSVITLIVEGKEISSSRYGSKLFMAAAKYISMVLPDADRNDIRLEELTLDPALVKMKPQQELPMAYVFKYKKLLEVKLISAFLARQRTPE